MKTKYAVGYGSDIFVIFDNLADAEEYLFSIIEELAYRGYCTYACAKSPFVKMDGYFNWYSNYRYLDKFKTLYGRILWDCQFGYWIQKTKEFS